MAEDGHDERRSRGRALRIACPRRSHAELVLRSDRSPNDLIEASSSNRVPSLVPLRYGRMSVSAFAYFRATAGIHAFDLANTPSSGILVPSCGDAHLANFGLFGTPERDLVFDVNDCDETEIAPWEWDVKRLATSVALAARHLGFGDDERDAVRAMAKSYRLLMNEYAEYGALDLWYEKIDVARLRAIAETEDQVRRVDRIEERARKRTQQSLLGKLTDMRDDGLRLLDRPPLIFHLDGPYARRRGVLWHHADVERSVDAYRLTLAPERRALFERFRLVDSAFKVVGVGSVGTRSLVLLFLDDHGHPLFLQLKEASPSALAPYLVAPWKEHQGARVVAGLRVLQATSDPMLGYTDGPSGREYFVRQLRDMKASASLDEMDKPAFVAYARTCAWALARAHARASGRALEIGGYLGTSDRFERAITRYATAYADQVEQDFDAFRDAVREGRFEAERESELRLGVRY